jgi:hypothetical protein
MIPYELYESILPWIYVPNCVLVLLYLCIIIIVFHIIDFTVFIILTCSNHLLELNLYFNCIHDRPVLLMSTLAHYDILLFNNLFHWHVLYPMVCNQFYWIIWNSK